MSPKSKSTAAQTSKPEPLWSHRATGGGRGKALGVRWVIFVLLLLLAAAGIFRGFLAPVNKTIINEAPTVSISAVGEYAASFTREWFTWTDGDSEERRARLMVFNPAISNVGWNGQGTQKVTEARVFDQEQVPVPKPDDEEKAKTAVKGEKRYLITVRLTVDSSPTPFYVQVLASEAHGAYSVLSVPTPIPSPLLVPVNVEQNLGSSEPDGQITAEIEAELALFFRDWATGESTLSRFLKKDTILPPLGGGVTLKTVDRVFVPKLAEGAVTDKRSVVVNVTWSWPGGRGTAPAAYTVDLVRDDQWFVTGLRGGIADGSLAPSANLGELAGPPVVEGDLDGTGEQPPATPGVVPGVEAPADDETPGIERGESSPDGY